SDGRRESLSGRDRLSSQTPRCPTHSSPDGTCNLKTKNGSRERPVLIVDISSASGGERKLEFHVSRVIAIGEARAANVLPSTSQRGAKVWSPAVFERRAKLECVGGVSVESAALTDNLSANAGWMSRGITERSRRATARPNVVAAEIVVRKQLRAHWATTGSIRVSAKARRNAALSTALRPGRRWILVVDESVSATKRDSTAPTRVGEPNSGRHCGEIRCHIDRLVRTIVQQITIHVEIGRPTQPAHSDVEAEQIKLGVPSVEFGRPVKCGMELAHLSVRLRGKPRQSSERHQREYRVPMFLSLHNLLSV